MRRRFAGLERAVFALLAALWGVAAGAQVVVEGSGSFNRYGEGVPSSGDMSNTGDVYVLHDIELGSQLYLNRILFMEASASGASDSDQTLYFYDGGSRTGESFGWDDSEGSFELTDDLRLTGTGGKVRAVGNDLVLVSDDSFFQSEAFLTQAGGPFFNWIGVDSQATRHTLMRLVGPTGDLLVKGAVTPSHSFDLAEAFWASEPVEPGQLVALDPRRPDAVRPARGPDDVVVGVVSANPGIALGGGVLTVEELRSAWGPEVTAEYLRLRPELIAGLLAEQPSLRAEAARLETPEAHRAWVLASQGARPPRPDARASPEDAGGEHPKRVLELDRQELEVLRAERRGRLADALETEALGRFMETRFAMVALAGRVPVAADATSLPIRPGDPLGPSPSPGRVMRATAAGVVVATALEGLDEGTGTVLALVGRSWFGGGSGKGAATGPEAMGEPPRGSHPQASRALDAESLFLGSGIRTAAPAVAEYHRVIGPVAPGEVVVAARDRPAALEAGRRAADPAVVGIVTGDPGVLLGERMTALAEADPEVAGELEAARRSGDRVRYQRVWQRVSDVFHRLHAPVALAGTVPARVDASYGGVEVGDLLTTSPTRGHLMRASSPPGPGTVVGKALEPLAGGRGTIRVLVMLR